jgi:hypothetical protein
MKHLFLMLAALAICGAAHAQVPTQMQSPGQQNSLQNSQPRNSLNTRDSVGGRTLINDNRNPSDRRIAPTQPTTTSPNAVTVPTTPAMPGNPQSGMPNNPGSAPTMGNPSNNLGNPGRR